MKKPCLSVTLSVLLMMPVNVPATEGDVANYYGTLIDFRENYSNPTQGEIGRERFADLLANRVFLFSRDPETVEDYNRFILSLLTDYMEMGPDVDLNLLLLEKFAKLDNQARGIESEDSFWVKWADSAMLFSGLALIGIRGLRYAQSWNRESSAEVHRQVKLIIGQRQNETTIRQRWRNYLQERRKQRAQERARKSQEREARAQQNRNERQQSQSGQEGSGSSQRQLSLRDNFQQRASARMKGVTDRIMKSLTSEEARDLYRSMLAGVGFSSVTTYWDEFYASEPVHVGFLKFALPAARLCDASHTLADMEEKERQGQLPVEEFESFYTNQIDFILHIDEHIPALQNHLTDLDEAKLRKLPENFQNLILELKECVQISTIDFIFRVAELGALIDAFPTEEDG